MEVLDDRMERWRVLWAAWWDRLLRRRVVEARKIMVSLIFAFVMAWF